MVEVVLLLHMPEQAQAREELLTACVVGIEVEEGQDALSFAGQHVFLVAVVRVEGRPTNIGAVDDLLHRDVIVAPLQHQRDQRLGDKPARAPRPPIRLVSLHRTPRPLRTITALLTRQAPAAKASQISSTEASKASEKPCHTRSCAATP